MSDLRKVNGRLRQVVADEDELIASLADAVELADGWAQLWDIAPVVLVKTHYLLPRRRCGCGCGTVTSAAPPFGRAGTVAYGLHLNAAAVLLGGEGDVPVQRTAMLRTISRTPTCADDAGHLTLVRSSLHDYLESSTLQKHWSTTSRRKSQCHVVP